MFGPGIFTPQSYRFDLQPQFAAVPNVGARALAHARRTYGEFKSAEILIPLSAAAAIAAYGFYLRLW